MSDLDALLDRFAGLSEDKQADITREIMSATADLPWVPNPGPQTDALESEADDLFYGGQAGGGKSDLILGSALTRHQQSLILRRYTEDARGLADRAMEILDGRDYGWNGQYMTLRYDERRIDFGGVKEERDKQRYKGHPHDLIGFDEIPDFLESQFRFICAWNRSTDEDQRCRVIGAGNPPTTAEGLWVINFWAPWLHPDHPNPAKEGELRWFTTDDDQQDVEVDGRGPHLVKGEPIIARSRTFIRSTLSDNPDLAATNYDSVLAALPPELRAAYREGRFDIGLQDHPYQVIPSAWLKAAQERWEPEPPRNVPMCAIGVDVAQGGADRTVLAVRHDGWYAPLEEVAGAQTPDGPSVAGLVLSRRRDDAQVIIDMGGGYGGSAYDHLRSNGIDATPFKGAEKSVRRTEDGQLRFHNKRAEAWWRFREALDPSQYQGSPIALPRDQELISDLTAPTFEVTPQGIRLEPKARMIKRLGRSPDKGDAVVMAWYRGAKAATHINEWRPDQRVGALPGRRMPAVNTGRRRRK